jgi:flagellar hook-associated protein 1 FlgK
MSLDLAFGIARSGLLSSQRAVALVSQNLANATTEGYTRKSADAVSVSQRGEPMGVRTGAASRTVDDALQAERHARGGESAAARERERLLAGIERVHGTPGDGQSLGDVMSGLRTGFLQLRASPGDAGIQRDVVETARDVALRFNQIANAVGSARQEAQDGIAAEVGRINATLREIAELTVRIQADRARGLAIGELEDQRDLALGRLSESLPVRALHQNDGGLVLVTKGGLGLPLDPARDAFATAGASVGPNAFYGPGGTLPGITLAGQDVTRQVTGGRLGEMVALRDSTLPRFQAELDIAAAHLASRLDGQGLRLFTNASGVVPDVTLAYNNPAAGLIGFAGEMRLNPAVAANPALLRDGTQAVTATPGGPTAFTPNPATGPAGFAVLLDRVLEHSFGETVAPGTFWSVLPATSLGPDGTLASPFVTPRGIEAYAALLTGAHTSDRAAATAARERADGLKRGLDTRFQRESGVDTDAELATLVQLQNAYAANARVMSTAQQMWDSLLMMGR